MEKFNCQVYVFVKSINEEISVTLPKSNVQTVIITISKINKKFPFPKNCQR